jgi:N,N'-diacetylchitobiose phosphorylase
MPTSSEPSRPNREVDELKRVWGERLSGLTVHTPDKKFDSMVNIWNAYQCFITFTWSRAASFIYCGLRDGFGYRDEVQDLEGIIHLDPEMALGKLRMMISGQVSNGAGLPLIPYDYRPGHVKLPGDPGYNYDSYRGDDALWLFPAVWKYICETGKTEFLDEIIPFADKGEATVYEHLKRAISFSQTHSGSHGLPAGLYADWNDCLRLGEQGESVFIAFQLYLAMDILKKIAVMRHDKETEEADDIRCRKAKEVDF